MSGTIFQSRWYHLTVATIYLLSGITLLVMSSNTEEPFKTKMIGVAIMCYGLYRFVIKFMIRKSQIHSGPDIK